MAFAEQEMTLNGKVSREIPRSSPPSLPLARASRIVARWHLRRLSCCVKLPRVRLPKGGGGASYFQMKAPERRLRLLLSTSDVSSCHAVRPFIRPQCPRISFLNPPPPPIPRLILCTPLLEQRDCANENSNAVTRQNRRTMEKRMERRENETWRKRALSCPARVHVHPATARGNLPIRAMRDARERCDSGVGEGEQKGETSRVAYPSPYHARFFHAFRLIVVWEQIDLECVTMARELSLSAHNVRVCIEIVWPLILFFILMWVRTRGLRIYIHECHFDAKAMPSAGLLPFVQSTVCTLNNTCHREAATQSSAEQQYNTSLIIRLVSDVNHIVNEHLTNEDTVNSIKRLSRDLETLSSFVKKLTSAQFPLSGRVAFEDVLKNDENTRHGFESLNISNKDFYPAFFKSSVSVRALQKLWTLTSFQELLKGFTERVDQLSELFTWGRSRPNGTLARVIQVSLCGRNMSSLLDTEHGPAQRFEEFREQVNRNLQEQNDEDVVSEYVYDNTTSPRCNAVFRSLEHTG
ncbi:hypothetical protein HPB49_015923 [Dermacentor silvarum]|uniref:Uncharacterized protein n=1 Tax=Dermacentor silvarum TaxID=543639 RepID=A0ACB8DEC6_DERSI|nr:hypothetical protein HPB49_015923 [Dermacentor silvarum]